jgi:hypothetical protein
VLLWRAQITDARLRAFQRPCYGCLRIAKSSLPRRKGRRLKQVVWRGARWTGLRQHLRRCRAANRYSAGPCWRCSDPAFRCMGQRSGTRTGSNRAVPERSGQLRSDSLDLRVGLWGRGVKNSRRKRRGRSPRGSTAPFWPLNEIVRGESPRAMNSNTARATIPPPQNEIVATAGAAVTSSKATSSAAASPTSF